MLLLYFKEIFYISKLKFYLTNFYNSLIYDVVPYFKPISATTILKLTLKGTLLKLLLFDSVFSFGTVRPGPDGDSQSRTITFLDRTVSVRYHKRTTCVV